MAVIVLTEKSLGAEKHAAHGIAMQQNMLKRPVLHQCVWNAPEYGRQGTPVVALVHKFKLRPRNRA